MKILLYGILCLGSLWAADGDSLGAARKLAADGHRPEALQVLERRLADDPADSDALLLHGIILSWNGQYEEARNDLQAVLDKHRDYRDALDALIRVEMWSSHPQRAEELARELLRRNPRDAPMLLAHSKALRAMGRGRDALVPLHRLLELEPGNQEARQEERDSGIESSVWMTSFDQFNEWYSDRRTPSREAQFQLERQTTMGPLIARFSQAERFSLSGRQVELDAYPHLRRGMYAYLNAGYSPDARLYPRARFGAELYQALGRGWEGSAGFRQLRFADVVNIYTPSLTKYFGSWMFTARAYLTPGSTGTSRSFQFLGRRYFGAAGDYWGVQYGHGSSLATTEGLYDIELLTSSSLTADFRRTLHRRVVFECRFGVSREDRLHSTGLRRYLTDAYIGYLF